MRFWKEWKPAEQSKMVSITYDPVNHAYYKVSAKVSVNL